MVLALTKDLNVLDNDHLVVALLENGVVDNVANVLLVTLGEEEHGLGVASRGVEDTGPVGVFADAFKDGADGALELLKSRGGLLGALLKSLASSNALGGQKS